MEVKNDSIASHYEIIANAFKIIDVASSLYMSVGPEEKAWSIEADLMEPDEKMMSILEKRTDPLDDSTEMELDEGWKRIDDRICLVKNRDAIYGYIKTVDGTIMVRDLEETAEEKAILINPNQIVPGLMPVLKLMPLFKKHDFFFVLVGNEITHFVSFNDMDKLPIKLCLFSLFMHLESEILELLTNDIDSIDKHLSNLALEQPKRFDKALKLCEMKYGKNITPKRILLCTTFIDKKIMLNKNTKLYKKLFKNEKQGGDFFNLVERVRNQIAHSESILTILNSPEKFNRFLDTILEVTTKITNLRMG